jgi:histidinol dehydrogenase
MKIIISPARETWDTLCKRPGLKREDLEKSVMTILNEVKTRGDRALFKFSEEFEGVSFRELKVTAGEILNSVNIVPDNLKEAIQKAKENIEKFHSAQLIEENKIETTFGVICWRKSVAIEKVGLYIPGGTAPLFSTILMLGIPATIAGCKEIIICTPPDKMGTVNPVILYTSQLLGINSIYKIGGAQAIAAMAFGTESVPKVYKIFGPGNQFVTKAKELVQQEGIAIDIPAGPSETLVIADYTCNPEFVAADLLSQAEHGPDSQVVLLTDNENVMQLVKTEIEKQLLLLPRKVIAEKSLSNSLLIIASDLDECVEFSNRYAPEHLIINTSEPITLAGKVRNAGSVFLGNYSCESAGDYASGTNHTLPTNGFAKSYSGVSTDSFVKKITFQEISKEGILNLGPSIELMAEAESLFAHKNAVTLRLKSLKNG